MSESSFLKSAMEAGEAVEAMIQRLAEAAGESIEVLIPRLAEATGEDPVNHPHHYTSHPSGVECIDVVEHMNFNLGNAVKYLWRADEKGAALEDLHKAAWYVNREIARREAEASS